MFVVRQVNCVDFHQMFLTHSLRSDQIDTSRKTSHSCQIVVKIKYPNGPSNCTNARTSTDRFPAGMWTLFRNQIQWRNCTIVDTHTNPTMSCYATSITPDSLPSLLFNVCTLFENWSYGYYRIHPSASGGSESFPESGNVIEGGG